MFNLVLQIRFCQAPTGGAAKSPSLRSTEKGWKVSDLDNLDRFSHISQPSHCSHCSPPQFGHAALRRTGTNACDQKEEETRRKMGNHCIFLPVPFERSLWA